MASRIFLSLDPVVTSYIDRRIVYMYYLIPSLLFPTSNGRLAFEVFVRRVSAVLLSRTRRI